MAEKDELTDLFNESIAVRIPTSAMIPKAIIRTVNMVLNRFERIEINEIRKFSLIRANLLKDLAVCIKIIHIRVAKLIIHRHNKNFIPNFSADIHPMDLHPRIQAFATLGKILTNPPGLESLIRPPSAINPFFTPREVNRAVSAWASLLTQENLKRWIQPYVFSSHAPAKQVLVIMAGNIPLVGFHDFLSVLVSGHKFTGKLSSKDSILLPWIADQLINIEPDFMGRISFQVNPDSRPDAVIATGSSNSARFFKQDYGNLPHIIRKNRSSPAVLNGSENSMDLTGLASDILDFYGLGCRNVSKIFIPPGYDFRDLADCLQNYKELDPIDPYLHNLVYQRARLELLKVPYIDAGNILLVEKPGFHSPVGVVFTEEYVSRQDLKLKLSARLNDIQCIVGNAPDRFNPVPFGTSQNPALWDYADGIDTLAFLNSLSS